jgi:hypothetical protein
MGILDYTWTVTAGQLKDPRNGEKEIVLKIFNSFPLRLPFIKKVLDLNCLSYASLAREELLGQCVLPL